MQPPAGPIIYSRAGPAFMTHDGERRSDDGDFRGRYRSRASCSVGHGGALDGPVQFQNERKASNRGARASSRGKYRLGDEERENLTEVATIATLEIAPPHESDGWLLTVTVEDETGPRLTGDGVAPAAEQQIDLSTFYNEFIRPGRGGANVVADAASSIGKLNVTRLIEAIERNRHAT